MKFFFINNVKVKLENNDKSIINYCENIGINIPHFCYHPCLSISGNCRMCLVEVKNSPKPVVSCAMNILNNMEIFTDSPLVKKSRESVLEFLLLNHPLDCPICDQGGECDLQDQSYVFGAYKKRFLNFKKIVVNKNIGPIVKTVMTRCIHCTRCVRFATEISGTSDLGVFGRGSNMEIGTYVNKLFNSELSGNVIDICPVGALTSKQHSFISRSWEVKKIKSIDFSDGFCKDVQLFVRDNKIMKITPCYNKNSDTSNWISDKARFSYTGMFFSNNKLLENKKSFWTNIIQRINYLVYFHDHLAKHRFKNLKIIMLVDGSLSVEVLCLIILLNNKFNFLSIRRAESVNVNNSITNNFMINSLTNLSKLNLSTLLLLIGVNPKFEGSSLNLELRQRFLKGNFQVISIGSLINLTFPLKYIGLNLKSLKSICEGNNIICQDFISRKNPLILVGSDISKRKDSDKILELFNVLNTHTCLRTKNWFGLNYLNNTVNETGLNYLTSIKNLTTLDYSRSDIIYMLSSNLKYSNISNITKLKLLGYFEQSNSFSKSTIVQDSVRYVVDHQGGFIKLPSKTLCETSETFLNTEGYLKKSVKVIQFNKTCSKSNWSIIRTVFNKLNSIQFLSNYKINDIIGLNLTKKNLFKTFMNLNFLTLNNLNRLPSCSSIKTDSSLITISRNLFSCKTKIYNTKTILWLDDFFIKGKDNYSSFSSIMIKCSRSYRASITNFM